MLAKLISWNAALFQNGVERANEQISIVKRYRYATVSCWVVENLMTAGGVIQNKAMFEQ